MVVDPASVAGAGAAGVVATGVWVVVVDPVSAAGAGVAGVEVAGAGVAGAGDAGGTLVVGAALLLVEVETALPVVAAFTSAWVSVKLLPIWALLAKSAWVPTVTLPV